MVKLHGEIAWWNCMVKLQSPFAVILKPKKIKSVTVSTFSPSICHEVMGPDAMILIFFQCWVLSQVFNSLLSPSSRGSLVPLHFLSFPGCWYTSLGECPILIHSPISNFIFWFPWPSTFLLHSYTCSLGFSWYMLIYSVAFFFFFGIWFPSSLAEALLQPDWDCYLLFGQEKKWE